MRKNGREIKLKRVNELCIRTFLQTFIYIYSVKKKKISPALLQGEDKEMAPEITPWGTRKQKVVHLVSQQVSNWITHNPYSHLDLSKDGDCISMY